MPNENFSFPISGLLLIASLKKKWTQFIVAFDYIFHNILSYNQKTRLLTHLTN